MAQHNRNNWHHIPGIGGIMATGLSKLLGEEPLSHILFIDFLMKLQQFEYI